MIMKKYLTYCGFAAATLLFCACGSKNDVETTKETAQTEEPTELKIAYVELDTLMSQYQLYKDYSEVLTRKGNNIQKTLAQKQRALENHAASVQKKYESNEFTTRDELERAQASIQKEQSDLAELADRRGSSRQYPVVPEALQQDQEVRLRSCQGRRQPSHRQSQVQHHQRYR